MPLTASASTATLAATLQALRPLLAELNVAPRADGAPLERLTMRTEPPVVSACVPLEAAGARRVEALDAPLVAAFLDGVQRSRVVAYVHGTPLIFATVAAAVRQRIDGRLATWALPEVRRVLLASQDALGTDRWQHLASAGVALMNISGGDAPQSDDEGLGWHPHALRARAMELVALEREQAERQLAAQWCAVESRWLWIDGGIAGNLAVGAHTSAFGVVKSHNTLYGDAAAVRQVLALREGQRSPAFLVGHHARRAVASWYLRLRDAAHGDPLFGLVRVEISPPPALLDEDCPHGARDAFRALCDRLSAGILLERHPVSLPDARWDTLAYGVYAVETYLQSLIGP
jgi:hypothetical protein